MAWKKDNEGHFVADGNGNPVWITEAGEDRGVDYAAMVRRQAETNAESKGRKEELRKLNEKYARFAEIEDLDAWHKEALEALEFRKNAPEKDRDLKAQVDSQVEARTAALKSQLADRDKKILERDKSIAELTGKVHGMAVKADVQGSKLLKERVRPEDRTFIEREMIRAGAVDENGRPYYRYDDGETIFGENGNASIDEAIPLFLKKLGFDPATRLLSQSDMQGSNGSPNPNGGRPGEKNPWKKEHINITEQSRIMLKDPALAARLKQEAGAA